MRMSQYFLATLKKIPKNCNTISHQLMLKAGLIRQVSSGLYTWLPTGLRVLKKIKKIIREEMNKNGAIEIIMPIVQPARLWKNSGRWEKYGAELLRFKNRNNQDFILSPTHEEMVSELISKEIMHSYNKEFSLNIYQINTKYRDEIRPQFGIIRTKEFIMKDGYSFHSNQKSLQHTYDAMYNAYCTIFNQISLNFCVVQADPGKMGGDLSHEFQAHSKLKENDVFPSTEIHEKKKNNFRKLKTKNSMSIIKSFNVPKPMELIKIPYITSITELVNALNTNIKKIVKTIIVRTNIKNNDIYSHNFVGLVIRADHQLDYKKTEKISELSSPLSLSNLTENYNLTGDTHLNLLGPINLSIPLIIDYNVAIMHNFIAGSNIHDKYFFGMNWNKDLLLPKVADLYQEKCYKDININKKNTLSLNKFIEIGHIFQLGKKYLKTIRHNNDDFSYKCNKKNLILNMGCYGIGITRIIAVIIEQHHDSHGIIWPEIIAPFKLAIIPIDMHRSINVRNVAEKIYNQLSSLIGTDILIDDRQERPGTMFADIDLIGIPHILIISDRNLKNQEIEYKYRKTGIIKKIKLDIILKFLIQKLAN